MSTYTHTRKVCLGNYFCGDNSLIVSVVFAGDSLSVYGLQKLHSEEVMKLLFLPFCNALNSYT